MKLLDVVRLVVDLPEEGLKAGATGTIVHVHGTGEAYEVEFDDQELVAKYGPGIGGTLVTLLPEHVR